jgi:hypothetical protein
MLANAVLARAGAEATASAAMIPKITYLVFM